MESYFYDVHTHIVPNVDDGANSTIEMRKMLMIAYQEGIRTMIATPHFIAGRDLNRNHLQEKFQCLQEEARKISDDFRIYLGNELYYSSDLVEKLNLGHANTLAGSKYVLVEFSVYETFQTIVKGIQDLIMSGYRPILAHIERYQALQNIKCVEQLVEIGCYIQVNASSFQGGIFDRRARYCKKMITEGYVHFIGSDCHNSVSRMPMMKKTYDHLRKYIDTNRLNEIFFDYPKKVIENRYI